VQRRTSSLIVLYRYPPCIYVNDSSYTPGTLVYFCLFLFFVYFCLFLLVFFFFLMASCFSCATLVILLAFTSMIFQYSLLLFYLFSFFCLLLLFLFLVRRVGDRNVVFRSLRVLQWPSVSCVTLVILLAFT
jgi:hypothetical protein